MKECRPVGDCCCKRHGFTEEATMKTTVLKLTGVVVIMAWLSLLPGYYLVDGKTQWIIWATAVALITEAGLWIAAATMGVAVFEARRRIWARITGKATRISD